MTTRIECPSCGVPLKLKNLDVLKRGVPCPKCKVKLPASWPPEEEILEAEILEVTDDDEPDSDSESHHETLPDQTAADSPPADVFLKVYSPRISFREYWWGTRNPLVFIAWLLKILRVPLPSSTNDPPVTTLEPFATTFDSFSKSVRSEIEPAVADLRELGFRNPVLHNISHTPLSTEYHIVTVGHQNGDAIARLQRRHWTGIQPNQTKIVCSFITSLDDGTFLVTTDEKADMAWPDSIDLHRETKADIEQLWEQHQETLANNPQATGIRRVRDRADAIDILEEHHQTLHDFHISRGAFQPLAASQKQQVADALSRPAGDGPASEHADVLAEIEKQQNGQSSWVTGLAVAVISAAFFLGLGAARWDWKTVWVILPILFVHELGHYLAMRMFGYRNLKMFFIPLFGAAVTGRNYNVAGWKKVVVSLAGPVPGILIGSVLGVYGLWHGIDLAVEIAVMSLILNGLNLLPVLPLDGGWVAHSLFFSRHYAVDVAFRILTAVVLIGASAAVGDRFLIGLGILMVMGIPTVLRSGKIIHRLKGQLSAVSADEQTIPPATAERIINEIQEQFPAGSLNTKLKAQVTLDIFQSLNTAAPGVVGTLTLAAIHAGSLLCAVVMLSVFVVGQHANLDDLFNLAIQAPETPYECGSSQITAGPEASENESEVCLVASFADAETAASAYSELNSQIPATGTMRLFGQTILLALPGDADGSRDTWIGNMEAAGAEVVVRSDDFEVPLSIAFISATEQDARRIHRSLQLLFDATWVTDDLIPPWSPHGGMTEEHIKARFTLRKLRGLKDEPDGSDDEKADVDDEEEFAEEELTEVDRLYDEMSKARRHGNTTKANVIRKKIDEINRAREKRRIDEIRALGPDVVHLELIDVYEKQPVYSPPDNEEEQKEAYAAWQKEREAWQQKLAPFLGQVSAEDDPAALADKRYAAARGYASRAGLIHQINYAILHREVDGVAAITDWLCDMDCIDIKYRFGDPTDEF